jgi:hypothetical protein
MIQSGNSDWIINFHAFGIDSGLPFYGYRSPKNAWSGTNEGFLFGGLSPPNKKLLSLRPQRLSGELNL